MQKIFVLIIVCLGINILSGEVQNRDSSNVQPQNTQLELFQAQETVKKQMEKNDILFQQSKNNFELASKIIEWSAMFFALLAVVLIIAGALGIREFSNIRKIETEMKNINQEMRNEISKIQELKTLILTEIEELKLKAKEENKNFIKISYLQIEGISRYQSGELAEAISIFNKIKAINPNDYDATCYIARSYIGQGKYEQAIKMAEYATTIEKKSPRAFAIQGEAYRLQGKYKEAIEALHNAIEWQRKPSLFNSLAYAYFKQKNYEAAKTTFNESLEIKPNHTAFCGLGKCAIKTGSFEDANKYFENAIRLAKHDIDNNSIYVWPYYSLAFSYLALGNRNDCIKFLKLSFEKNKNPAIIKEQLFDFEFMKDENNISQALLKTCLKEFKKNLT